MKSKREQRHASIIFKNGNMLSACSNSEMCHSEERAINSAEYYGDLKGLTMVNIRLTQGGKIGLSKPCPACMELLKVKKFRKVIYSTNEGTFKEEYL